MIESMMLPRLARNPFAWMVTLLLAILAWIPTLQQTLSMLSMPMYGTMGMSLVPFLFFWTFMMAAMMLPALAPTVSMYYTSLCQQRLHAFPRTVRISIFILGYLCLWLLFGIPVFFLAALGEHLVFHAPIAGVGLGITVCIAAGLYQMTPLKQRCLTHCNSSFSHESNCRSFVPSSGLLSAMKSGLLHGIFCLGCCGHLMLVLLAVGFMNLLWMLLVTVLVFLEKVWPQGPRLSFSLGVALIFFGLLSFIDPSLLPGLYAGRF